MTTNIFVKNIEHESAVKHVTGKAIYIDDISSVFMAINTEIKNKKFKSIKIVCGGMSAIPKIANKTETFLKNKIINFNNISKAKIIISKEFSPLSDVRSSKNYRKNIISNLLDRFLNEYNNKRVTLYDF